MKNLGDEWTDRDFEDFYLESLSWTKSNYSTLGNEGDGYEVSPMPCRAFGYLGDGGRRVLAHRPDQEEYQ